MKRALAVVLFRLFTIGVCVDGYEVSVTEGDSVTLKSGVTELKTLDDIEWRFSGSRIATITRNYGEISVWVKADGSSRLQLNNQTGDLKIINISTTDSGQYKPTISSRSGSPPEVTFTVKVDPVVVPAAAVKSVSVLKGYTVTLQTGLTEIQRDKVIQWTFEQQKSLVAEINRDARIFNTYDGPDDRFRDRLKLDQTGSLTITNIKTTDSGLYEVEIGNTISSYIIHHTQSFRVTVSDPHLSPAAVAGIVGGGLLLAAAVAGVICYRYKKSKEELSEKQLSVLYEQLEIIHMQKEASKTQQCQSAGSDTENSQFLKKEEELYEKLVKLFKNQSQPPMDNMDMAMDNMDMGTKENGYDSS